MQIGYKSFNFFKSYSFWQKEKIIAKMKQKKRKNQDFEYQFQVNILHHYLQCNFQ